MSSQLGSDPQGLTPFRTSIYSDARLFERYLVVRHAFNYGIAIRRDGPYAARIEAAARRSWATLYPEHRFEDFVVRK